MDLKQQKLGKSEWESIEVPVDDDEKEILSLIVKGYSDVNIRYNKSNSLFSYLKIDYNESMEDYLYNQYFSGRIGELREKYGEVLQIVEMFSVAVKSKPVIKKADLFRIEKNDIKKMTASLIYEHLLIDILEEMLSLKAPSISSSKKSKKNGGSGSGSRGSGSSGSGSSGSGSSGSGSSGSGSSGSGSSGSGVGGKWLVKYFTLYKLLKNNIQHINKYIRIIIEKILSKFEDEIDMTEFIANSVDCIEKNLLLLKYSDMLLYEHQKQLFTLMRKPEPKLVLYIAPTGTGKTLSPLAISEQYKVIFVCAVRHVGLALARAAISVNKKIAFAFGCGSAADVRLHYFSVKDYIINRNRHGEIIYKKVDNSVGDKVEIMICDVKSYLPAMYYMTAFNPSEKIVTYWDEPTITMDYENHDLHETIKNNWRENIIPNMVLSSATLPKLHELAETCADFRRKFRGSEVHAISSNDNKKTIPILNKNGYVVLPHYLSADYNEILRIVAHCEQNLTLLRYFDLREVVDFIMFLDKNSHVAASLKIGRNFASLDDITMQNIKIHYLKVLGRIDPMKWTAIYSEIMATRQKRVNPNIHVDNKGNRVSDIGVTDECAIFVTTKDAYTLTDGPTLFLATDVEKIARFCIQQANIPALVMEDIVTKINFNNKVNKQIAILSHTLEDLIESKSNKDSCADNSKEAKGMIKSGGSKTKDIGSNDKDKEILKINEELDGLRLMVKSAELNETFIPNSQLHLRKWSAITGITNAFTCDIDEQTIIDIMLLEDVNDSWKILLLMGIGIFTNHKSIAYTEIMKKLADHQRLYMIIADGDYIYGTNYQFCHGYISKDMTLTQEKAIQSLGRIGRNHIQKDYSVRLRDDEQARKIFWPEPNKPEVRNMNILFNCRNIIWTDEKGFVAIDENADDDDTDAADSDADNATNGLEEDDDEPKLEEDVVVEESEDDDGSIVIVNNEETIVVDWLDDTNSEDGIQICPAYEN
uniref:Helicase/UvrB N-terminal domain-containing protein n=1 Tax=viral metagenome TaxID=1070528 RepID=A0A6C0HWZ4_9ZZZZ